MSNAIADVTTTTLQAFADAWNRHDIDALMSFMTDDCGFEASAGAEVCGARYAGRDAVRAGFSEVRIRFHRSTSSRRPSDSIVFSCFARSSAGTPSAVR